MTEINKYQNSKIYKKNIFNIIKWNLIILNIKM